MKAIILILIMLPVFCFAQNEHSETAIPNKPSTTACPTWKKKKNTSSKADYFQYLRTSKPKANPHTASTDYLKAQPNTAPQNMGALPPTINEQATDKEKNSEELAVTKPKKNKRNTPILPEQHSTLNPSTEERNAAPKSEEKIKLVDAKQTPKNTAVPPPAIKQDEENTVDSANASTKQVDAKDNSTTEKTKLKRKMNFMFRKKTKVHKHSNSKCPSF